MYENISFFIVYSDIDGYIWVYMGIDGYRQRQAATRLSIVATPFRHCTTFRNNKFLKSHRTLIALTIAPAKQLDQILVQIEDPIL